MIQAPQERGEYFEFDPYGLETRGRMLSSLDALIERNSTIEDTEFREEQPYTGEFKLTHGYERFETVPMIHRRQLEITSGDTRSIAVKDEDITAKSIIHNLPEPATRVTARSGVVAFRLSQLSLGAGGVKLNFFEKTFGSPSIQDLKGVGYNEIRAALSKEKENLNSSDTAVIRSVAHLLHAVHLPGENEILLPDFGIYPRTFNY